MWSFLRNLEHLTRGMMHTHPIVLLSDVMPTVEIVSAVRCTSWTSVVGYRTPQSFLKIQTFLQNRKKFKNSNACMLGAQMGSNHEKIEVKNLVTNSV